MFKAFLAICLGLTLALATTGAHAQDIVVTVDDDPGNDAAYVDGTGGNFSGATGVKDAMVAINADPNRTSVSGIEVRLVDTDGTADTYTGDVLLQAPNITLHQVPNGNGNDQPITLVGDATLLGEGVGAPLGGPIAILDTGCSVSGLSADKKLIFQPGPNQVRGLVLSANVATDATWRWIEVINNVNGTAGADTFEFGGAGNFGTQTFIECTFNQANGPNPRLSGNTYIACEFNASGFPLVMTTPEVTVLDSVFNNAFPININDPAATTLTLERCTFSKGVPIISDFQFGGDIYTAGMTVDIIDPSFSGTPGVDPIIQVFDEELDLTIRGTSAESKVDLRDVASGGFIIRFTSGTVRLVNCLIEDGLDSLGAPISPEGVDYVFEGCEVRGAWIGRVVNDGVTKGPIRITATNTLFEDISTDGDPQSAILQTLLTAGSSLTLNHCTFYGQGGVDVPILLAEDTTVEATNCIFDGTNYTFVANTGDFSASQNNLVVDGLLGGLNGAPAAAVVTGDPQLTADGKLQVGSDAIDAAIGISPAIDIEGQVRPSGAASDLGADEFRLVNATRSWTLY